ELPDCTITTVEVSKAVIALRNEFAIPPDSDIFKIVHADAAVYMRNQHAIADVILLDGYNLEGLPVNLGSQAFYDRCFEALRPGGILVSNLWGSDRSFEVCFDRISHSFEQQVLAAQSDTSENRIAFGLKQIEIPLWVELQIRARRWQRITGFNF